MLVIWTTTAENTNCKCYSSKTSKLRKYQSHKWNTVKTTSVFSYIPIADWSKYKFKIVLVLITVIRFNTNIRSDTYDILVSVYLNIANEAT